MVEPDPVRLQQDPNQHDEEAGISDPLPEDALDINVEGRNLAPSRNGFGKLWRKRFQVRLTGVQQSPAEIISTWREHYGDFWPEGSRFYRPLTGLKPGEIALADLEMLAGARLSTGVIVVRSEPTAFTFMTPEGHTFAGHITFSARQDSESGDPIAQVVVLMRASDPIFEIGMPLGGHARENTFWMQTLTNLAQHYGVDATPTLEMKVLDNRRQWSKVTNIVNNSFVHTALYMVTRPFRMVLERLTDRKGQS